MLMTPEVFYENTSVKSKTFYKIKWLYLLFVLKPLSALLQFNLVSVKSNLIKLFSINFHQLRLLLLIADSMTV